MSSEERAAERKIVTAAITCIERQGIQNVTIRSIAKEAGVNSAAINYYFRSKDKLIAKAMATTLAHLASDLREIATDDTRPLAERLGELLDYLIEGAIQYPQVTRAHLSEPLREGSSGSEFGGLLAEILAGIREELDRGRGHPAGRELDLLLVQLFSAAILPALMPTLFQGFSGIDFRDLRTRRAYVELLIREVINSQPLP